MIAVFLLAAAGILIYIANNPSTSEAFTEFYILGQDGKAAAYPVEITMDGNRVSAVQYDDGVTDYALPYGKVFLGILNQENQAATYIMEMKIDGQPAALYYQGESISRLDDISLGDGESWEGEIGIVPLKKGDGQVVEFLLFKDNSDEFYRELNRSVNVK